MSSTNVRVDIDGLAQAVTDALRDYNEDVIEGTKVAVKKAAKLVQTEIKENAPVRKGKYQKSWTTKTTMENAYRLEQTVYSPSRYMLAHLLEKGHALRNGGRTAAQPHIAPAEQHGIEQLEREVKEAISKA